MLGIFNQILSITVTEKYNFFKEKRVMLLYGKMKDFSRVPFDPNFDILLDHYVSQPELSMSSATVQVVPIC